MALQIGIITLFPEIFNALNYGVTACALKKQRITIKLLEST